NAQPASKFMLAGRAETAAPSARCFHRGTRVLLLSGKSSFFLKHFGPLLLTWHRTSPFLGHNEYLLLHISKIQLAMSLPGITFK
ncbi:PREDICTED: uncharacterized protein LOC103584880, partial [Galeopterus variegatus]|uniref:Uncharacterized protein LOC103584880 n=1 Tax=Galeopterus variegatus TaxID=482537 RepID=A0ABM0Q6D2_GALVR